MSATQPQTRLSDSTRRSAAIWLTICLVLVGLMILIGGLTRLTQSGLSIVDWKPISGILPPLDDEDFTKEFNEYKVTPQFTKSFPNMGLDEFKHIYWLEYIHRLLGRIIGAVFFVPLFFCIISRELPWKNIFKFTAIFALGGAQGFIGWYMVKSGLIDDPRVSPYRLALHLSTGFILFGLILWQILTITHPKKPAIGGVELPKPPLFLKIFACLVLLLIFMQIIIGAFVAGLHAGLTYNTFPLMDGHWIPEGIWPQELGYRSLFEDITTVQFAHRAMAYSLTIIIPVFWFFGRNNPHVSHLLAILFCFFIIQALFGILTLLFLVPVPLASLHQVNALLLFSIAVTTVHRLFIPLESIDYEIGSSHFPV